MFIYCEGEMGSAQTVEIRGQLVEVSFFLPRCVSQERAQAFTLYGKYPHSLSYFTRPQGNSTLKRKI